MPISLSFAAFKRKLVFKGRFHVIGSPKINMAFIGYVLMGCIVAFEACVVRTQTEMVV